MRHSDHVSSQASKLTNLVELADRVIALVEATDVGGTQGDRSSLVMFSAYLHGLRRMRCIRDVANAGAGPEAVILTRSLLSILARAGYVDAPTDKAERSRRYEQFARSDLLQTIKEMKGLDIDAAEIASVESQLSAIPPGDRLPLDAMLIRDGLGDVFYDIVYVPSSDFVHFGLAFSIAELRGQEHVDTKARQDGLAAQALRLAILVFGALLQVSERSVAHGLDPVVRELVESNAAVLEP